MRWCHRFWLQLQNCNKKTTRLCQSMDLRPWTTVPTQSWATIATMKVWHKWLAPLALNLVFDPNWSRPQADRKHGYSNNFTWFIFLLYNYISYNTFCVYIWIWVPVQMFNWRLCFPRLPFCAKHTVTLQSISWYCFFLKLLTNNKYDNKNANSN